MTTPVTVRPGENVEASVMGVSLPFPWEAELRAISPIHPMHSHLRAFWYRAKSRWVLYDCMPARLLDRTMSYMGINGDELLDRLQGKPNREREDWDQCPFVSDTQHEFHRLYRVWARPFWVLQGDSGGHQVWFSPWQQNVLRAKGLPVDPPVIGSLPPCPWDNRVVRHLQHLNRLHQMADRMEALIGSGSREAADREMDAIQRDIRLAEAAFVEEQMTPIVDMAMSLVRGANTRSEHATQIVPVRPGMAAAAADAWDRYLETGDYTLTRDLTGIRH